jgi:hypothetical protein
MRRAPPPTSCSRSLVGQSRLFLSVIYLSLPLLPNTHASYFLPHLTQPGLLTIIAGIVLAREIFQRMIAFLTYRISASLQLLLFFFIAVLSMHPEDFLPDAEEIPLMSVEERKNWKFVYHMPVILLMLITLLNDGALISIGYDKAKASKLPTVWNIKMLYLISSVLAGVALLSSLFRRWCECSRDIYLCSPHSAH